ncbi:MAG: CapA family protein [Phycisphaerales bacterium]|nr:MAG: CapA family protein [Phycisphaerales bacterium]
MNRVLITIFLCGDVMTGRGIDQILPHSVDPVLHEPYVRSAKVYVRLAEERTGPIDSPVDFGYIWGDALDEFRRIRPSVRVVNLETSVTTSDDYWKNKSIHYRMHPENTACITAADIDCCVLANNHLLDWGYAGLNETAKTLRKAGVRTAGVGQNLEQAAAPAVLGVQEKGRVLVFAFGSPTGGVPREWAATATKPGINYLPDFSDEVVRMIAGTVEHHARDGDVVVFSIHWGGNWGYRIPGEQIEFARRLIDEAGVDIVHGHSSHHVKGLEVYNDRLILYGSGDFLNDYEGIAGHERYRPDLTLMYFPTVDASTGALTGLRMTPMQIRNFRLHRADRNDAAWLRDVLNRESEAFGARVLLQDDGTLTVRWDQSDGADCSPVTGSGTTAATSTLHDSVF